MKKPYMRNEPRRADTIFSSEGFLGIYFLTQLRSLVGQDARIPVFSVSDNLSMMGWMRFNHFLHEYACLAPSSMNSYINKLPRQIHGVRIISNHKQTE